MKSILTIAFLSLFSMIMAQRSSENILEYSKLGLSLDEIKLYIEENKPDSKILIENSDFGKQLIAEGDSLSKNIIYSDLIWTFENNLAYQFQFSGCFVENVDAEYEKTIATFEEVSYYDRKRRAYIYEFEDHKLEIKVYKYLAKYNDEKREFLTIEVKTDEPGALRAHYEFTE